jgi:hypothetical protein
MVPLSAAGDAAPLVTVANAILPELSQLGPAPFGRVIQAVV